MAISTTHTHDLEHHDSDIRDSHDATVSSRTTSSVSTTHTSDSGGAMSASNEPHSEQTTNTDEQRHLLACPKCDAEKIAKSRPQGSDRLVMRLLPKRPYRCLRCYHRFWHSESFVEDPRRVKTWLTILAIIIAYTGWQFFQGMQSNSSDQGASNAPSAANSSIASSEPNFLSQDSVDTSAVSQRNRSLIEASGFQPPRDANAVIDELAQAGVSKAAIRDRLSTAQVLAVKVNDEASQLDSNTPQALPLGSADDPQVVNAIAVPSSQISESQQAQYQQQIELMLEQWRRAWSSGDSERYLEFYSVDFKPSSGISRNRWQRQRIERVVPSKAIELNLSDIQTQFQNEGRVALVEFQQDYRSADYSETSRKELRLNRIANQWYIASEVER